MKATIYETITNQIVTAIEEGAGLYMMPWHRARADITNPINLTSGRSYRGLNIISLWMIAEARQFGSGTWATYRQWQEKGAQVRKGEKSAAVFFCKNLNEGAESEQAESPEGESRSRFVARGYSVFNADQVDGYEAPAVPVLSDDERIAEAEAFFAAIPARVTHEGNQACYIPAQDAVRMVPFGSFRDAKGYYSVLAHELTHWSGAKQRLDRDLSGRFGSESYAMESWSPSLAQRSTSGTLACPMTRASTMPLRRVMAEGAEGRQPRHLHGGKQGAGGGGLPKRLQLASYRPYWPARARPCLKYQILVL